MVSGAAQWKCLLLFLTRQVQRTIRFRLCHREGRYSWCLTLFSLRCKPMPYSVHKHAQSSLACSCVHSWQTREGTQTRHTPPSLLPTYPESFYPSVAVSRAHDPEGEGHPYKIPTRDSAREIRASWNILETSLALLLLQL